MKYIKSFLNKTKMDMMNLMSSKRELSNDILYSEISSDDLKSFQDDHKLEVISDSEYNSILKFVNKNNYKLPCSHKSFCCFSCPKFELKKFYSTPGDDRRVDGLSNLAKIVIERNGLETKYGIKKFSDDWFIVIIVKKHLHYSSKWRFKCDTVEGVEQLILNYKNYT